MPSGFARRRPTRRRLRCRLPRASRSRGRASRKKRSRRCRHLRRRRLPIHNRRAPAACRCAARAFVAVRGGVRAPPRPVCPRWESSRSIPTSVPGSSSSRRGTPRPAPSRRRRAVDAMTSVRDANGENAAVVAGAAAADGVGAAVQAVRAARDTKTHAAPTWATVRPAVIVAVGAAEVEAAGSATAKSGASRWWHGPRLPPQRLVLRPRPPGPRRRRPRRKAAPSGRRSNAV